MVNARAILQLALGAVLIAGCSFERAEHAQACSSAEDCGARAQCYAGYCVPDEPMSTGCAGDTLEACYEGPPSSEDVGVCRPGQRLCADGTYSECLGQVVPSEELCNRKDDDCDGTVDEVLGSAACDTALKGACSEGTLVCRDGIERCQPARESQAETCNTVDDDCDGTSDELAEGDCYPEDAVGCVRDALGPWRCLGQCATGRQACSASCEGAVTPGEERCTESELAQDEDCDGEIDEGCACESGATRECYAGPAGTRDLGICRAGTQACAQAQWGPCQGQVMPAQESCSNPGDDDDCDDIEDDVPGLGATCVAMGEAGECRNGTLECGANRQVECVAGEPSDEECDALDQDCDGDPTNGFDLGSDARCGACDRACAADETCCNGECIDAASLERDPANCGACGIACGASQYCCQGDCLTLATPMAMPMCTCKDDCGDRACCGDSCRDLQRDAKHCGACGRACKAGESCAAGVCKK